MIVKKIQADVIKDFQNNPEYIILDNALATPKFIKKLGKNKVERIPKDIYTPKIYAEIISKITPQIYEDRLGGYVQINFNVSEFLDEINVERKSDCYSYILNCIDEMQRINVKYDGDDFLVSTSIIPKYKINKKKGDLTLDLSEELAERILTYKKNSNFSYLKKYLFGLNNSHAINLFQFFVAWKNNGFVEVKLDVFKTKFGYDTEGYARFASLKSKVIDPALKDIKDKTLLEITYTLIGKNLEGIRPRVKAIRFFITEKAKSPLKTGEFEAEKAEIIEKEADNKANESTDKERISSKYETIVIGEFGVNAVQFVKILDTYTEGSIINAIEITKKAKATGKIKNIAGFFVEALKNGYIDQAEIKKKEQIEKSAKMKAQEAQIKLKEAAEKTRQKAVFEADAERIIKILEGNLALQKKVLDAFLSDFVGKTTFKGKGFKEILESPMGKGMLIGIAKKFEI